MENVDYTRFDSLGTEDVANQVVHYNANLLHTHKVEYKANLLKRDRTIGGKHLVLTDGGENGSITALDMRILYFNSDGKRVSIRIARDHQLTGNRLCCGCSVAKSSHGWIKLYFCRVVAVGRRLLQIFTSTTSRSRRFRPGFKHFHAIVCTVFLFHLFFR